MGRRNIEITIILVLIFVIGVRCETHTANPALNAASFYQ
jgi:hypothetical protein